AREPTPRTQPIPLADRFWCWPLWRSGCFCKNVSRKRRLLKVFETRHSKFKDHSLHGHRFFLAVGAGVVMLGFIDGAWSQQRRNDRTHDMVTAENLSGTPKSRLRPDRVNSTEKYVCRAVLSVNTSR